MAELDETSIQAAEKAIRDAITIREYHRGRSRKGSNQREVDLKTALDKVRRAMKPIRSYLVSAGYGYGAYHHTQRARALSADLQAQRRKLWRMQKRPK